MKKILRAGAVEVEIGGRRELSDLEGRRIDFPDTPSALEYLRRFVRDPLQMGALRDLLASESPDLPLTRVDDHELLGRLAPLLASGRLGVLQKPVPLGGTATGPPQPAPPPPPPSAPAEAPATRTWIKFRVVEDETGKPVQGVGLKVKLPTGEVRDCTTDANGMVRIDDLPHGTCDIEKMTDADALEVVALE